MTPGPNQRIGGSSRAGVGAEPLPRRDFQGETECLRCVYRPPSRHQRWQDLSVSQAWSWHRAGQELHAWPCHRRLRESVASRRAL